MTDKPHRPDGDGLLASLLAKLELLAANGAETLTINQVRGLIRHVEIEPSLSQTRDGASGADWHADFQARCRALNPASPKPAPDAMREALQNETVFQNVLCECIDAWRALPEYAEVTLVDWLRDAGIIATPTAPMPPPADGKNLNDVRWAVNVLLEKIAAKFEANETYDIWRSDAAAFVRSFKHDLSPSPAVAAEPVANPAFAHRQWLSDLLKTAEAFRVAVVLGGALDKVSQDTFINQLRALETALNPFNYRSSLWPLASPPVRGDRETIARIIAPEAFAADYQHYFPDRSTVEQFNAYQKADAILSLPVQPGAGEREAAGILRGWAKAYRDTPEHRFPSDPNAEFFPVDLENAADLLASRQAPHSSREGGG